MTVDSVFVEPNTRRSPGGRRVIGYVHARSPFQSAHGLKSITDYCQRECHELVHNIEDDCPQDHNSVDCPAFLELIEYLTRDRVDLVLPALGHLSTNALVISLRLDRIDATTRQVLIVPNQHADFHEMGT